jgi:NAD(P)-dependent dehydrogenase (short-subunit alcohol dehydrogenase family)
MTPNGNQHSPERYAVVTGASTGIGEGCALRLDKMGWHVFATIRTPQDADALKQKASDRLTPLLMDVTNPASIADAAKTVAASVGEAGLHALVNNAGIAVAGPLEYLPVEELRKQLEVHVIGQIAVTQQFLSILRKARGRVINIGSVSGRITTPLMGPYCASKYAIEALTGALRMELQPWGIKVILIAPAAIATPIWRKALAEGDRLAEDFPQEAFEKYGPIITSMRKFASGSDSGALPRAHVVRSVVHALTTPKPRTRYTVGTTARLGEVLRFLPDRLRESLIMRQFK